MPFRDFFFRTRDTTVRRAYEQIADDTAIAYVQWRSVADEVERAYGAWSHAAPDQEPRLFVAFCAALNREDEAAADYAAMTRRFNVWAELAEKVEA